MPLPRPIRGALGGAFLVFAACGEDPVGPPGPAAALLLRGAAGTIAVGDTVRLVAEVVDAAGRRVPHAPVELGIIGPGTLRLLGTGEVVGWEAGPGSIIARSGAFADTVSLQVAVVPRDILLQQEAEAPQDTFLLGRAATLRATVVDGRGRTLSNLRVTVTSSDTSRAAYVTTADSLGGTLQPFAAGAVTLTIETDGFRKTRSIVVAPSHLPVTGIPLTGVVTGSGYGCGLDGSARAQCWGLAYNGSLGRGALPIAKYPLAPVSGTFGFTQLAAGGYTACGIATTRRLHCWGEGAAIYRVAEPTPMLPDHEVVSVAVGQADSGCASTSAGQLWCWLEGGIGRAPTSWQVPAAPALVQLAMSEFSVSFTPMRMACGVTTTGRVHCLVPSHPSNPTSEVAGSYPPLDRLAIGDRFGCGLASSGEAWCWGLNESGQLGRGSVGTVGATQAMGTVSTSLRFTSLKAGRNWACGLATDGRIMCWGAHPTFDTLTGRHSAAPRDLFGDARFQSLVGGNGYGVCGRAQNGDLRCMAFDARLGA